MREIVSARRKKRAIIALRCLVVVLSVIATIVMWPKIRANTEADLPQANELDASLVASEETIAPNTTNSPDDATLYGSPTELSSASQIEPSPEAELTPKPSLPLEGLIIGIDPGHQIKENPEKEPNGPNTEKMKKKVSSGTQGKFTGVPEHVVNLAVGLKLQKLLSDAGATVVMTRTVAEIDISNKERAELFNEKKVDLAVRLHCNGSDDTSVHGAFMLVTSDRNSKYYKNSEAAAEKIIAAYCEETEIKNLGVRYVSAETGFNWCERPITNIEMGHMTNEAEDKKLTDDDFQTKMAAGIFNGIVDYFSGDTPKATAIQPEPTLTATPADTPAPLQPAQTEDETGAWVYYCPEPDINVRAEATKESAELGKLKLCEKVIVYEVDAFDWCRISYNGKRAYVAGWLLKKVSAEADYSPVTATVNDDDVKLRAEPTTASDSLHKFKKNDKLKFIRDAGNGWGMVEYDGKIAFISLDYINK